MDKIKKFTNIEIFLSMTTNSELFKINKQNKYIFAIGKYKDISLSKLYEINPDLFIEYLENTYQYCNNIDKKHIDRILKRIKNNYLYE